MRVIINAILLLCVCVSASAKNTKLEDTEANCKKVDAIANGNIEAVARKFEVSISSVRFLGTRWGAGRYGLTECIFRFDTAKGPKNCSAVFGLLSDDGGKTAFATVANSFGDAACW